MKQNALQGAVPAETEDLNVEHLQLLLLIFHSFSEKGRRDILMLFVQIIQELSASMDAQMRSVPLTLARLLLIFDYLLHQYSKAPVYLFEQVQRNMFFLLYSCSRGLCYSQIIMSQTKVTCSLEVSGVHCGVFKYPEEDPWDFVSVPTLYV